MDKPIRVLNVTTVLRAAGIESFIMNVYRNMDRTKIQYDFMVMRNEKEFYDDEIFCLGGKKYTISINENNTLVRIIRESIKLYQFLKKNPYQIIHVHYTTPLRAFYLLAAKMAKVPVRIYHSHSAEVIGKSNIKIKIYDFCKKKITKWATDYFACSKAAAEWMFEKDLIDSGKVQLVYNGIDTVRFRFREEKRKELRRELDIENDFVVIHTGRFIEQKNQNFVLDVFLELKTRDKNTKLLLLGTGDLLQVIKDKARQMNLLEDVLFLDVKPNVEDYLCAADCYLMPSLYEGLPVAAVEAECVGLPCILSENITKEVKLTENTTFLSLNDSLHKWADKILETESFYREDKSDEIAKKGYDVRHVSKWLEQTYLLRAQR